MSDRTTTTGNTAGGREERDRRGTYLAVLLTEVLVILGLWAFSAYFGATWN